MTRPRPFRAAVARRAGPLALAALAAAGAAAQAPAPVRSGFWFEAGAGTGGVWVGCEGCADVTASFGENVYVRGGGAFSDRVLWGVELFGLPTVGGGPAAPDSTLRVNNVSAGPVVLWYPWGGGVFVKGGVGLSRSEVRLPGPGGGGAVLGQATGTGLSFGVGLDVPLFRRWALTASLGSHVGAVGDLTVQDASVDDVITTMYNASVALTLR